MYMDTKIVSTTDFIRNFGTYADMLPKLDKIILTREGRPFASVKSSPEEKNRQLLRSAGIFKGTPLEDDKFWKKVLKRKSKKKVYDLSGI